MRKDLKLFLSKHTERYTGIFQLVYVGITDISKIKLGIYKKNFYYLNYFINLYIIGLFVEFAYSNTNLVRVFNDDSLILDEWIQLLNKYNLQYSFKIKNI